MQIPVLIAGPNPGELTAEHHDSALDNSMALSPQGGIA
jgi:hypothetical protein